MGPETDWAKSRLAWTRLAVLASIVALFVSWQYLGDRYRMPPLWIFACLLSVEMLLSRLRGVRIFSFGATLDNVFMGGIQRVLDALFPLFSFALYVTLYENHRLIDFESDGALALGCAVVAYDFAFYWAHRASHQINLLWAAHIVHHQSEEFNLSVSFRQSPFQYSFYFFFYLGLALAGIGPALFFTASVIHQLWQFVVHERVDGSLGGIESVLITPSTHGLHHAINEEYLDKNFGGILSVWDRLFGTFVRERPDVEPRYGIVRQLGSWNPIAAVLTPWAELLGLSLQSRSLRDLARVWFGRPDYLYQRLANATPPQRRPPSGPRRLWVYLLAQVLLPGVLLLTLLARGGAMTPATRLLSLGFVLASMYCAGALQDRARFAVAAERARLVAVITLGWLGLLGFEQLPGLPSILELPGDATAVAWTIALGCSGFALASLLWLQRGYPRPSGPGRTSGTG